MNFVFLAFICCWNSSSLFSLNSKAILVCIAAFKTCKFCGKSWLVTNREILISFYSHISIVLPNVATCSDCLTRCILRAFVFRCSLIQWPAISRHFCLISCRIKFHTWTSLLLGQQRWFISGSWTKCIINIVGFCKVVWSNWCIWSSVIDVHFSHPFLEDQHVHPSEQEQ